MPDTFVIPAFIDFVWRPEHDVDAGLIRSGRETITSGQQAAVVLIPEFVERGSGRGVAA